MNHIHHPLDRRQRLTLKAKKFKTPDEKKSEAQERAAKVWRARTKEALREQEVLDDLKEWNAP